MKSNTNKIKKIAVVYDDEDIIKLLIALFEEAGFQVRAFTSGKEAIKALIEKNEIASLDVLLLDRLLPDMDGLDILKKIQESQPNHCPILFLSVLSSEKDMLKGLREGAFDYVTKPFSTNLLLEKVNHLINK